MNRLNPIPMVLPGEEAYRQFYRDLMTPKELLVYDELLTADTARAKFPEATHIDYEMMASALGMPLEQFEAHMEAIRLKVAANNYKAN